MAPPASVAHLHHEAGVSRTHRKLGCGFQSANPAKPGVGGGLVGDSGDIFLDPGKKMLSQV